MIPAPLKPSSRKPAVVKLVGCQRTKKKNGGKITLTLYAALVGFTNQKPDCCCHSGALGVISPTKILCHVQLHSGMNDGLMRPVQ